jgi:hypothetical protein
MSSAWARITGISKQATAQQLAAHWTSARRFLRQNLARAYEPLANPIIDIFHFYRFTN